MSEMQKEIVECDEHTANKLLGSGEYVFLGNYVKEHVCVDEGIAWVHRRMNYCLARKKKSFFQTATPELAKTQ